MLQSKLVSYFDQRDLPPRETLRPMVGPNIWQFGGGREGEGGGREGEGGGREGSANVSVRQIPVPPDPLRSFLFGTSLDTIDGPTLGILLLPQAQETPFTGCFNEEQLIDHTTHLS